MSVAPILHETRHRLRLQWPQASDSDALVAQLRGLAGVVAVRANPTLKCLVVQYDGAAATREAVLRQLSHARPPSRMRRRTAVPGSPLASRWLPGVLAAAVPALTGEWRRGTALAVVAARVATQPRRLREDPSAVLLDAASLASLALGRQELVVSTSVLLRLLAEGLSERLIRQADELLDHLLPIVAAEYSVLRERDDSSTWSFLPLRSVRTGDRVRLFPGDVVPVDGSVVDGAASLHPLMRDQDEIRRVGPGDHLLAGERLHEGTIELLTEADARHSRLSRLRAHVQHAMASRDPPGRLTSEVGRLVSLPLTAAALVLGLTGDSARAASMLQADPQQGLDLALPLAREAALYALARIGLLSGGLDSLERLASAHTLVLQDTGVVAVGRWEIAALHDDAHLGADALRRWLGTIAGLSAPLPAAPQFPDLVVRQWVRHGAVLRVGDGEVHLASHARLRAVWGLSAPRCPGPEADALYRELMFVKGGRVVARLMLRSALRPDAQRHLIELRALGMRRIAVCVEDDGCAADLPWAAPAWADRWQIEALADHIDERTAWLAEATADGKPLAVVHAVLRDLVPPGSLSLTPVDADAGAHGVLLGDPLASLVAARRLASSVQARLRRQQSAAVAANAALMTAAALRWLPPIATTLAHHGFALLLLLDSLRIQGIGGERSRTPAPPVLSPHRPGKAIRPHHRTPRRQTA